MKLFSRKALVAGATAIAVSFAGINVANAAENEGGSGTSVSSDLSSTLKNFSFSDLSSTDDKDKTNSDGKKIDPDKIKAWIGVVSAVIGVLGSIFTFLGKHINLPGLK